MSLDAAALTAVADRIVAKTEATYADFVRRWHLRAERMFLWLMVAQWLFGIFVALVISPFAWEGKTRVVSNHVWAAIVLGGLLSALPIALIILRPGWVGTRHVIAFSQVMWSALLIHLTGGRIETHFHVFGSLAFLAFYRDWKVLVTATVTVAADHFLRGLFIPESVYGVADASIWRFAEHAGWVVFEDLILLSHLRDNRRETRELARRQASIESITAGLE
ncbi:MAG TPA: histidine kinase, partial [Thermoanaerobaculia bacterium]|nr:histidine kinase [Thermoanaerobaculia bacterium]